MAAIINDLLIWLPIFLVGIVGYFADRRLLLLSGLGFMWYGFHIRSLSEWASYLTVLIGIFMVVGAFTRRERES